MDKKANDFVNKIKKAFEGVTARTVEARILEENIRQWSDIQALWDNALENALRSSTEYGAQDENTVETDSSFQTSIRKNSRWQNIVKADRKVIQGNDASKWGKQLTDYINQTIRKGKTVVPDYKNHQFAKDGFNYRTAYFLDEDGSYYRLTISVGINGTVNTVYNVGKIKEDRIPLSDSKVLSSKKDDRGSASDNNISQTSGNVNGDVQFSVRGEQVSSNTLAKFPLCAKITSVML